MKNETSTIKLLNKRLIDSFFIVLMLIITAILPFCSAAAFPSTGLRAYYNFNDVGDTINSSQNNLSIHTGTPIINSSNGLIGNGSYFNGASAYQVADIDQVFKMTAAGTAYTHSGWVKIPSSATNFFLGKGDQAAGGWDFILGGGGSNMYYRTGGNQITAGGLSTGTWHMITLTINSTDACILIDAGGKTCRSSSAYASGTAQPFTIGGISSVNGWATGYMDEWGFWNRTLTDPEISTIYNSGAGLTYGSSSSVVTLNSPIDFYSSSNKLVNFNCSATVSGSTLVNMTLWTNSTGTWKINKTNTITGTTNTTNFTQTFPYGNYLWACRACDSLHACSFSAINRTLLLNVFEDKGATYNNPAYEASRENFTLNFSVASVVSATGILNYNGTSYASSVSCISDNCIASNSIDIPTISGTQQNRSFYWTITTFNGTGSNTATTILRNQTVNSIGMNLCPGGSVALNFTAYDEQNQTRITSFNFDATFNYYIGSGSLHKTFSITNASANEVDICITQNTTYTVDSIIAYYDSSRAIRNYFTQSFQISNATQHIPLYLLNTASSTQFILQVQDRALLPVPQVLVNAQKCFLGSGANETVFISRTDNNGYTTGNFEAYGATYQFFITNQSNTLLSVIPCSKIVPQTVPYTLTFQLGESYHSPFSDIKNISNINESLYFNHTSNTLTLSYADTSGIFDHVLLLVSNMNYSGIGKQYVCNYTSDISTGLVSCNISTDGTYTAQAYVYRTNQILIDQIVFTVTTAVSTMGYYGVFLAFFMIVICGFAFKFNEIAGIWLLNAAVITCNYIGLITFGNVFITAMLAISIVITVVLER